MTKSPEDSSFSIDFVACFTHERKFIRTIFLLWACSPFMEQGYQYLGSWCEKVTKKERSDHISHISPLSSDQPSGTLDPLQGGWPTLGFHRSPMLPTMWGLSRVSRAEKDSISGLLLALSDLSKWLGWDIWLRKPGEKCLWKVALDPFYML